MTLAGSGTINCYGSWTMPAANFTMSYTGRITFCATSTGKTVTSNGYTWGGQVYFDGVGGGWQLQDNLTSSSDGLLFHGALDLNNLTLQITTWNENSGATRSIAWGTTGKIKITGQTFDNENYSGFSQTGTSNYEFTYAGSGQITVYSGWFSPASESQAPNFKFTGGATGAIILNAAGGPNQFKNLDVSAHNGTFGTSANNTADFNIYGDVTLGNVDLALGTSANLKFRKTSGIQSLTSAGKKIKANVYEDGVGGTLQLADPLLLDSGFTLSLNLTNGTFDANNKAVTASSFASSNSNTRVFKPGSGAWTLSGAGTVFDCSTTTGLTVNSHTAVFSLTSASAKTFAGGGKTWGTVDEAGAGALTFTGANTFSDITSTVHDTTVKLPAGVTTTVSALSIGGASGHTVTLTSSTGSSVATLSKASGTVSLSYVSVDHITATGGATFNARTAFGCVDGGNNTGWQFTAVTEQGTAGLTAVGALTANGKYTVLGSGTLAAGGTLSATGKSTILGTCSLTGTGTLTGNGRYTTHGLSSLAASGTLAAAGVKVAIGISGLTASGSITGAGIRAVLALCGLTASGTLGATGKYTGRGSAGLTSTGTLSGTGRLVGAGGAALAATGSLSDTGLRVRFGTAGLAASGTLSATAKAQLHGVSALAASGTVTATGKLAARGLGGLTASGTLNGTGHARAVGVATFNASGTFAATGAYKTHGQSALEGNGAFDAVGHKTANGVSSLMGAGALTASGHYITHSVASFSANGVLNGHGGKLLLGLAQFSSSSQFNATGKSRLLAAAQFSASGELTAVGRNFKHGRADLLASASLTASGNEHLARNIRTAFFLTR